MAYTYFIVNKIQLHRCFHKRATKVRLRVSNEIRQIPECNYRASEDSALWTPRFDENPFDLTPNRL